MNSSCQGRTKATADIEARVDGKPPWRALPHNRRLRVSKRSSVITHNMEFEGGGRPPARTRTRTCKSTVGIPRSAMILRASAFRSARARARSTYWGNYDERNSACSTLVRPHGVL